MVELNADAPRITDRLCDACADHFAAVRAHLDALGIDHVVEPGLVRGLDYYTRTAFEFWPAGRAAASSRRSAAAAATTAWSSCSAASRRRASASGSGSTASCSRSTRRARTAPADAPAGGRRRRRAGGHGRAARDRDGASRGAGLAIGVDLAPRKLGRQLEARGQGRAPVSR